MNSPAGPSSPLQRLKSASLKADKSSKGLSTYRVKFKKSKGRVKSHEEGSKLTDRFNLRCDSELTGESFLGSGSQLDSSSKANFKANATKQPKEKNKSKTTKGLPGGSQSSKGKEREKDGRVNKEDESSIKSMHKTPQKTPRESVGATPKSDNDDPIDMLSSDVHSLRIDTGATPSHIRVEYEGSEKRRNWVRERRIRLLGNVSPRGSKTGSHREESVVEPGGVSSSDRDVKVNKNKNKTPSLTSGVLYLSSDDSDDDFNLKATPPSARQKLDFLRANAVTLGRKKSVSLTKPHVGPRVFPMVLGREEKKIVDEAFRQPGVISTLPGAEVAARDLRKLRPGTWINDEVITFYSVLINIRSKALSRTPASVFLDVHCFNSFFYATLSYAGYPGVRRWTRKISIFEKDIIIVPINVGNTHWCCAAINIARKRFEFYDSLGGRRKSVYKMLRNYIEEEHLDKQKKRIDLSSWEDYYDPRTPQQLNGSDCGIFTCQFMESLSRKRNDFDFSQKDMGYLRQKMVLEIVKQELILEGGVQ